MAGLEVTPQRLAELSFGLEDDALPTAPGRKAWSAVKVLAHLRACAENWTYSTYAKLSEKNPVLPDINERKRAKAVGYASLPFGRSLQAFTLQREELLSVLRPLPPAAWECQAMIFARQHTVFTQARRMAKHKAKHCHQMESILR